MRTFAYDGPVEWESFADHLVVPLGRRPLAEPRLVRRPQHGALRRRRVRRRRRPRRSSARWSGYVAEAMDAGALGLSTGLEFNPGRAAPTDEIVRLNKVVGRYGGYYTSHVRNRDAHLQDSIDEFLQIIREGGTQRRDLAPQRPPPHRRRAGRLAARGRHDGSEAREVEGLDVLADTTPFRDGLGQMAGILPPWVLADGWEEALQAAARPGRRASGCAATATATGASSTRATGTACGCRRASQYPGLEGIPFDEVAARRWGSTRGTPTSRSSPRPGPGIESLLLIGELFTDEHLAEMISHPLFCLGVDGYTASLDAGLDGVAGPPGLLRRARALPHAPRRRGRDAAARGGDPQDDRRCRRGTSASPTAASCGRGMAADLVVLDLDRLADGSTLEHPLAYVEGVDEVLVNGVAVVEAGEHTGRAARAAPAPRA